MAKSKFRTFYCENCRTEKKMQILSFVEGSETKVWHKCTRCRHSFLIDLSKIAQPEKKEIVRDECIDYSPLKSYSIGSSIYHQEWDDVGLVVKKVKISSGMQAIEVDFEKNGSKKLIENYQEE